MIKQGKTQGSNQGSEDSVSVYLDVPTDACSPGEMIDPSLHTAHWVILAKDYEVVTEELVMRSKNKRNNWEKQWELWTGRWCESQQRAQEK